MLARIALVSALAPLVMAMDPAPIAPVIPPKIVNGDQSITLATNDIKQVAKGRFYVSRDRGATWQLALETTVDPANPVIPVYTFKPQGDGDYYIMTAAVYRNGTAEEAPKANSIPGKSLLLVVDATAPVVSTLEATPKPITDPNATSGDVDLSWAISETNLASASLEQSVDGGASFSPVKALTASGTTTITVPRPANATVLLRIIAKDTAGNQSTSLAKSVLLPAPPDPEKALATAVSALPTVAEVQPVPDAPAPAATGTAGTTGTATTAAPATGTANLAPITPDPIAPATTSRNTTAPTDVPYLLGHPAQVEIDRARALRDEKKIDEALAIYLRVHRSDQAKAAIADELAMLREAGDSAAVAAIASNLSPELRTDTARLEHGRALLAMGKFGDAEGVLSTVRKGAAESREALLYLGKAAQAQGKNGLATRIYEKLASGDDAVAAAAKLAIGK